MINLGRTTVYKSGDEVANGLIEAVNIHCAIRKLIKSSSPVLRCINQAPRFINPMTCSFCAFDPDHALVFFIFGPYLKVHLTLELN